jgi:hypothetical protein
MLDLKAFKKTAEDDNTATLTHKDGHKISIVKNILSPNFKKQLAKLPLHQADGSEDGPVASGEDAAAMGAGPGAVEGNQTPVTGQQVYSGQMSSPQAPDQITANVNDVAKPNIFTNSGLSSSSAQPVPSPEEAYNDIPGYAETKAGIEAQQAAEEQQGNTSAALQNTYAADQEKAAKQTQAELLDKSNTIKQVTQDIMNSHINPNQYLENMSAGKKVSTALGLILGGMGSAKTGGPNPAMQFLNNQIERNLAAQQANISNKHNLLSALEKQYGDKMVAANMFRAINANVLAAHLGAATSTAQSQLAKAAGLQGIGQLKSQAGQFLLKSQLMHMKSSINQGQPGSQMDAKANQYLQAARTLDPEGAKELESRYIPGVGAANVPLTPEDRKELQTRQSLHDLFNTASDYMSKTSNHGLGPIPGLQQGVHAEGQALQNQVLTHSQELSDLKRYTPLEDKIFRQGLPDLTGTHFTGQDAAKLKVLRDTNDAALNTFFQQKGIPQRAGNTDKVSVLGPKGNKSFSATRSELPKLEKMGYKPAQ